MKALARSAAGAVVRLRLGRGRREVQLLFGDGSYLHFRQDRHTSWVQPGGAAGELAAGLAERVAAFELAGRRLSIEFDDGSRLTVRQGLFGRTLVE
ncbi:hypothetical protein [Oceanithermus sp.]